MLTYKREGTFNEGVMNTIFQLAGFSNQSKDFDPENLIQLADRVRPGRTINVGSKTKNFKGWDKYSPDFIVDRVYGLDYIVKVRPSGDLIGFNFPTNLSESLSRAGKLATFKPMWQGLGLSRVVVLNTIYPAGEDQGLVFYDSREAVEDLYSVIFSALEGEEEVSVQTLTIRYEA